MIVLSWKSMEFFNGQMNNDRIGMHIIFSAAMHPWYASLSLKWKKCHPRVANKEKNHAVFLSLSLNRSYRTLLCFALLELNEWTTKIEIEISTTVAIHIFCLLLSSFLQCFWIVIFLQSDYLTLATWNLAILPCFFIQ